MTVILAAIVGFLTGRMLWLSLCRSWHREPLLRQNYHGVTLPTAGGIILSLALLVVEGVRAIVATAGVGPAPGLSPIRAAALVAVLGFTILGLIDDLVGTSGSRGFTGHLRAFGRGELTSGMVKMIGGTTAAVIAASLLENNGFISLVVSAGVIALSANFFNLLDFRPGRTTKAGIAAIVILAIIGRVDTALVPAAIVVGAAASLILDDLRERVMLGDTGANALGAGIGLGLVTQVHGNGRIALFLVMLVLNLASEVVSYTNIISKFPPLRFIDNLGRRRPPVIDIREPAASPPASPPSMREAEPPLAQRVHIDEPSLTMPVRSEPARREADESSFISSVQLAEGRLGETRIERERVSEFDDLTLDNDDFDAEIEPRADRSTDPRNHEAKAPNLYDKPNLFDN